MCESEVVLAKIYRATFQVHKTMAMRYCGTLDIRVAPLLDAYKPNK